MWDVKDVSVTMSRGSLCTAAYELCAKGAILILDCWVSAVVKIRRGLRMSNEKQPADIVLTES